MEEVSGAARIAPTPPFRAAPTLPPSLPFAAPAGPPGGAPRRALLFLGSPRCSTLRELGAQRLFLSDVPAHDATVDYLLLSEQRSAEAGLKEKYERMALELKVRLCCT
jgi:hypothetical protein